MSDRETAEKIISEWAHTSAETTRYAYKGLIRSFAAALAAEREAAADMIEAEAERLLACQTGKGMDAISDQVNVNLRMMAAALPPLAAAIRARETQP